MTATTAFVHEVAYLNTDYRNGFPVRTTRVCTCGRPVTAKGDDQYMTSFRKHQQREAAKAAEQGDAYRPMYADRPWNYSAVVAPLGDDRKGSQRRVRFTASTAEEAVQTAKEQVPAGYRLIDVYQGTRTK